MSTASRGGRRRSPIWEHFVLGHNADGNRVAECKFCARVMKSQPDRMENHFLKICPQVDDEVRRRWVLTRENNATMSLAAATHQQRQRETPSTSALPKTAVAASGGQSDAQQQQQQQTSALAAIRSSASIGPFPGSSSFLDAGAFGEVAPQENGVRRQPRKIAPAFTSSEQSTVSSAIGTPVASPAPAAGTRKSPPSNNTGSSATKRSKQTRGIVESSVEPQQQSSSPTTASRQRGAAVEVSTSLQQQQLLASASTRDHEHQMHEFSEFERRKLELDAHKAQLEIESMRFDNDIKRIKVAEENMLARKRLQDAGVPQADIDLLLPLQPRAATR